MIIPILVPIVVLIVAMLWVMWCGEEGGF